MAKVKKIKKKEPKDSNDDDNYFLPKKKVPLDSDEISIGYNNNNTYNDNFNYNYNNDGRGTLRSTIGGSKKKIPKDEDEEAEQVNKVFRGKNQYPNEERNKFNNPEGSTIDPYRGSIFGPPSKNPNPSPLIPSEENDKAKVSYRPSMYRPTYNPSVYQKTSLRSKPPTGIFPQDKDLPSKSELKYPEFEQLVSFSSTNSNLLSHDIIQINSHMEIPEGTKCKSPLLSTSGLYFACIAEDPSEEEDVVYVWEINNLSSFKHKFTRVNVDSIAFTPDSLNIILVYKETNPVMYSLKDGNKVLDFSSNGEEGNRVYLDYGFISDGKFFGYASEKSFSLWSVSNGDLIKYFPSDAPIKKIFPEHIAYVKNKNGQSICTVIQYNGEEVYKEFNLKGVSNPKEVLDCRLSTDKTYFIYVVEDGPIIYDILSDTYSGVHRFKRGSKKAFVSEDCDFIAKTDMTNLDIYDIYSQEKVGSIVNEPFDDCSVSFENGKIILINQGNYIHFHDFVNKNVIDQYIWLNKCPSSIKGVKFSKSGTTFLAKVDDFNYFSYNTRTKKIMKKWKSQDNYKPLVFGTSPSNSQKFFLATKEGSNLIKVWDIENNKEIGLFVGMDANSFCFDKEGKFLLVGTAEGSEICRLWDLNTGEYKSFNYQGENQNKNTIAELSNPSSDMIVCCAEGQQPVVFSVEGQNIMYKCQCNYKFDKVTDIKAKGRAKVFLVKGIENGKEVGVLYRLKDGRLIENYDDITLAELSDGAHLITKARNLNKNNFCIADLKNLDDPTRKNVEGGSDVSKIIGPPDKEILASIYQDYISRYINYEGAVEVYNPDYGDQIGKATFTSKMANPPFVDVFYEEKKGNVQVKFINFISFEQTLVQNKRHITSRRAKDNNNIEINH